MFDRSGAAAFAGTFGHDPAPRDDPFILDPEAVAVKRPAPSAMGLGLEYPELSGNNRDEPMRAHVQWG